MPKKPSKYGLKYNCIVDVATSYLLDCNPYLGMINGVRESDSGRKIVLKLCNEYFGSNRNVTMDNFFTSIPLADDLFFKDLSLIGTLRANKVLNYLNDFHIHAIYSGFFNYNNLGRNTRKLFEKQRKRAIIFSCLLQRL